MSPTSSQRTAHHLAMGLRDAYWSMHRLADSHLERFGVTADQFVLLATLADEDGVTQQELGRRTSSDSNTVRAMLILLENRGYVSRTPHPTDRRALSVRLTPEGRQTFGELWAFSQPFRTSLLTDFSPGEVEQLLDLLARIPTAMRRAEQLID